jgi:colicin import membrane protein
MAAAVLAHDALLPRAPGGNGPGAVLALLVHAGLVLALTTSVDWRTKPPETVSAELWASVPQTAAPKPVEASPPPPLPPPAPTPTPAPAPPPAPVAKVEPPAPPPDIAFERAERRKAEALRKKAEADAAAERVVAAKKQADADKKQREQEAREAKAEDARLAKLREENLKRMLADAGGATGRSGTASQDAAPSAAYAGRLVALIRSKSVFTGSVPGNPAVEVEVRTGPTGAILFKSVTKSSGHKEWDDAVLRALDKINALPPDTDGRVPKVLTISFRPYDS